MWAAAGFKVFPVTSSAAHTPLNSALDINLEEHSPGLRGKSCAVGNASSTWASASTTAPSRSSRAALRGERFMGLGLRLRRVCFGFMVRPVGVFSRLQARRRGGCPTNQFQSVGTGNGPGCGSSLQGYRRFLRGAVLKPSIPMSNCVLKPTAGDMVGQNWSASAGCGLARR